MILPLLAAACMQAEPTPAPQRAPQPQPVQPAALPGFPHLGTALPAGHTSYDNGDLARLFTVMSHEMEGGARRAHLTRFETPVSIGLEGPGAEDVGEFLDRYLAQLRENAGIRISRGPAPNNLHVRFVDGERFENTLPAAVCVIAPGNVAWDDFVRDPLKSTTRALARSRRIDAMTIFIPDNVRPHEARNCLLEEVPQALGLTNDLYGLGMSSFNDDAAHLWPTKLDYLMLRLLYAGAMETGLDRRETELRARSILEGINPQGRAAPPLPRLRRATLDRWSQLIGRVFSRESTESGRMTDIGKALVLIEAKAPNSPQHCHTLVTAGRVLSRPAPERALVMLDAAARVCDAAHGPSDIRHARIRLEAACASLRLGRYAAVIADAEALWPVLAAHGQDERLAALYSMQSDALDATEPDSSRAAAARELADDWNAYAVGPGRRAANCKPRT
ncbi:MAG TPA: DUF2927 domain-containing protein [Thermohalobaculum sp.]|nr:DUF2927 domain-containing protein [Thermohalobaculum sp.]